MAILKTMGDRQLILHQFSRDKVEHGDFTAFLNRFDADRLPAEPALALKMGGFAVTDGIARTRPGS